MLNTSSVTLSVTNCKQEPKRGKILSINGSATVLAVLSGTEKAFGQPLYQPTNMIINLLPDKVV